MSEPRPPCKRYREIFTLIEVHGRTYGDVATELGMKQKSIVDICSKVRTWMRRYGARWDRIVENKKRAAIACELYVARLEHQWQEAMAAWYRSQGPQRIDKGIYKEGKLERGEVTQRSQTGDVRYLRQAAAVLEKICAMKTRPPLSDHEETNDVYVEEATLVERRLELTELLRLYGPGGDQAPRAECVDGQYTDPDSPQTLRAA
jgi:hypothetical protein